MQGIPHLTPEENRRYKRLRKTLIRTFKLQHLEGEEMSRKCQVEKLTVSAMGNVLAGTIDVDKSNSAARHGTNFVRLAENELKRKQFVAKEKRRSRALQKLNELKNNEPIIDLS